ncbi:MAG: J domain-containing protein [bacterium]|nr:MAG: J domain-containing protein [bacterium]
MDIKKDYYKILGISVNASQEDIKKAYRKLAKEHHPDAKGGDKAAENRFKDISEAYAVLKDPKKRKEYDLLRQNPFAGGQSGGFNYQDFRSPGGGFRVNFGDAGNDFGLDDILGSFFGFGKKRGGSQPDFGGDPFRQSKRRPPQKGADFQAEITIPFELVVNGGETTVQTPTGKKIKLKIHPGMEDGKKVKMTGQGSPGQNGSPSGDLYIIIHVAKNSDFERDGIDLYTNAEINYAQALLGSEIEITTINNKKVKLKIPAGTDSGKTFRLKKLGIQSAQGTGDLYVRVFITSPKNLSSRSKKLFQEWAKSAGLED